MKFENKGLVILLGALGIVIIGLVVGIVATSLRERNEVVVEGGNVEDDISAGSDVAESIREEIDINNIEDAGEVIALYQKHIDESKDEGTIIDLLNERIYVLEGMDNCDICPGQIIDDTIEIDNILQSISSAAQVVNVATEYGEFGIADEYTAFMEARELEEGIDVNNLETQG